MSSKPAEFASIEAQRAELETVLHAELFTRAPTLAHLLAYLCEKTFAGESDQIKEYSVAVDVFDRRSSFDQDADSIVRVQANRLRKRLAEYYAGPGSAHRIHISIPVGQYVPSFQEVPEQEAGPEPQATATETEAVAAPQPPLAQPTSRRRNWLWMGAIAVLIIVAALVFVTRRVGRQSSIEGPAQGKPLAPQTPIGLPVGDEIRILAGGSRDYVDRAGKLWTADRYFNGGAPVRSGVQYIWRTQDADLYRSSRQGEFTYDIPLKPGVYELRLHFAETFYGPEDQGGGGEGSRVMAIRANNRPLLSGFDVTADAGGSRTADVKVFTDVSPAEDGLLHLGFSSVHGGRGMLSAIEILPGVRGRMRPVRIVTRDSAYYSDDSRWWSPDSYFKGGQLAEHHESIAGNDDSELYESERWGHFSYAIPVGPGKYTVILHFVERRFGPGNRNKDFGPPHDPNAATGARVFNVFCNGKAVVRDVDILREVGENRPLVRKITGLEPNAQGKLILEFVPVRDYATVTAIEVIPE